MGRAEAAGADLVAFPELSVTGYPPEDLLLKPGFVADNLAVLDRIAEASGECAAVVGFVDVAGDGSVPEAVGRAVGIGAVAREEALRGAPRLLRNALAVCAGGRVLGVYHKRRLPNYGVFDEERWFAPGAGPAMLYEVAGVLVGVSVCEDLWFPDGPHLRAGGGRGRAWWSTSTPRPTRSGGSPIASGRRRRDGSARPGAPSRMSTRSVARTSSSSTAGRSSSAPPATCSPVRPQFEEALLTADLDLPGRVDTAVSPRTSPWCTSAPRRRDDEAVPTVAACRQLSEEAEVYGALVLGHA